MSEKVGSENVSFADELRSRVENSELVLVGFLKVVKRGLSFSLASKTTVLRVALVPNMILAIVARTNGSGYVIAEWCGPTLETDRRDSPYSESKRFTIAIGEQFIANGSLVEIPENEVVKMANHVPAVLF